MNIHSDNCLAHRLRTAATSKTFRDVRKLRNDISSINWDNILNETDAEVGDGIFVNLLMQVCAENCL